MKPKDEKLRVTVNWRPTVGELSPLLRRLFGKLLASRKDKPGSTRQDASDGELKNESEQIVPDE